MKSHEGFAFQIFDHIYTGSFECYLSIFLVCHMVFILVVVVSAAAVANQLGMDVCMRNFMYVVNLI